METWKQQRIIEILQREHNRLDFFQKNAYKTNEKYSFGEAEDYIDDKIINQAESDMEIIDEFLGDGFTGFYAKVQHKIEKELNSYEN
jgi:hypothetical protein